MEINIFDMAFMVLLVLGAFFGFSRGGVWQGIILVVLALGVYFLHGDKQPEALSGLESLLRGWGKPVQDIVLILVAYGAGWALGGVGRGMLRVLPQLRLAGAFFGILEGLLVFATVIILVERHFSVLQEKLYHSTMGKSILSVLDSLP